MKRRGAPQKPRTSRLALAMKARGISNKELIKRSGLNPGTVSHQRRVGIKTLRVAKRYAVVLDCDPLELLG